MSAPVTIGEGQQAALCVISAAAQSPTEATLAVLEAIPRAAFGSHADFMADVDTYVMALNLGDGEEYGERLKAKYGTDADPWRLDEYVTDLNRISAAFHKPLVKPKATAYTVQFEGDHVTVRAAAPLPKGKDGLLTEANLAAWEEMAERPIDSVFEQGLAAGKFGLLVAPGGTGKSYLAFQLALSVATGRTLLRGFTPSQRGPVLCLFGEDDELEIARRLKRICAAFEIPHSLISEAIQSGMLTVVSGQSEPLLRFGVGGTASHTEAHAELHNRCRKHRYRLVVVDPVVAWAGVPNENDNAMGQQAAAAFIQLAEASGGAVLGVHHQGKQSARSGESTTATGRGASSLTDASRWQATLQQIDEKNKLGIPAELAPNFVELRIGKNSYAERSGRALYMERKNGALVPVDLTSEKSMQLADAVAEELEANWARLTPYEIEKSTGVLAVKFRAGVDKRTGRTATRQELKQCIEQGVFDGRFGLEPARNSPTGASRQELVLIQNEAHSITIQNDTE